MRITKSIFSVLLFSALWKRTLAVHVFNITFIFDRCRRSSAAVAPVKYERDSNNPERYFTRSKILLMEKLTNGALVTPTLDSRHLTHWGRVTHICVCKLTNIDSYNGLSPERRQAIIWTNVGILLIEPLGTNFSEFLIGIHIFSFKKMHLKMSSGKWRTFVSASMC